MAPAKTKITHEEHDTIELEAEKIRIQAEAITKQGGAEYVQLQRIQKRDGQLPTIQAGEGGMLLDASSFFRK